MPNFSKLSQLQWRIIGSTLGCPDSRNWSESIRVAWVRGVSRLVSRGIVEQIDEGSDPDHWHRKLKLVAPLDEVKHAAELAWLRDQANNLPNLQSRAWHVLRAITEQERSDAKPRRPRSTAAKA